MCTEDVQLNAAHFSSEAFMKQQLIRLDRGSLEVWIQQVEKMDG